MTTNTPHVSFSPTTKNWAVSAIALATMMLLFQIGGLIFLRIMPNPPHYGSTMQAVNWILQSVAMITSICFIINGVAVVRARQSGPEMLSYTAVAAILIVLLSTCYQFVVINSVAYKQFLAKQMATVPSSAQMAQTIHTWQTVGMAVVLVVPAIIQVIYNVALYLHMSKR